MSDHRVLRRTLSILAVAACAAATTGAPWPDDPKPSPAPGMGQVGLAGAGFFDPSAQVAVLGPFGPKPLCDPKWLGQAPLAAVQGLGVSDPGQLVLVFSPLDQPVTLHKLGLQLFQGGALIWQSGVQCVGCLQDYAPVGPMGPLGYGFRLDEAAAQSAAPYFAQATDVAVQGVLHDGSKVRFAFAKWTGQ
jgi:hypothetical protein